MSQYHHPCTTRDLFQGNDVRRSFYLNLLYHPQDSDQEQEPNYTIALPHVEHLETDSCIETKLGC